MKKRDFETFIKNQASENQNSQSTQKNQNTQNTQNNQNNQNNQNTTQNAEKIYNEYKGKSEDELLREILKIAKLNKNSGNLTNDELEQFSQKVAPMLSPAQKNKLNVILGKLRT